MEGMRCVVKKTIRSGVIEGFCEVSLMSKKE